MTGPQVIEWTVPSIRQRARKALAHSWPIEPASAIPRGDYDLNGGAAAFPLLLARPPKPAAVLVGICARSTLAVLLTQRPLSMSEHAGQIAFPGGRIDERDESPVDAALREAHEEVGLQPELVEPIGYLGPYQTGTGYLITPVVGLISPEFKAIPNPHEVSEVFEVPLSFLMSPANHRIDTCEINGIRRRFHAMPYQDRYIWGATAGILKSLHERLTDP